MINSLLIETFTIRRRFTDTEDNYNESQYYLIEDQPCLVLSRTGEIEMQNSYNSSTSGMIARDSNKFVLLTTTEMEESDEIVYEDTTYMIDTNGLGKRKDAITGTIQYYRIILVGARPYPETEVDVKEVW